MTALFTEIAAALRRGACHATTRAECATCAESEARVERLRARLALPVIATCGDCSACRLHQRGGTSFSEPRVVSERVHYWLCHHDGAHVNADRRVDAMDAPPPWCPLRSEAP